MKKILITIAAAVVMLTMVLTGCGGQDSEGSAEETITAAPTQSAEDLENETDGCIEDSDDLLY